MTVQTTEVTLAVPAHPTPQQVQLLQERTDLQRQVRTRFWSDVRDSVGLAALDLTWPRPQVVKSAMEEALFSLLGPDDQAGRNYIERVVSDELCRLRDLPGRVHWAHLQPGIDADTLTMPNRPVCVGGDLLLLPDTEIEIDAFALPRPFDRAVVAAGAQRILKWRRQLTADLEHWDRGVTNDEARRVRRHLSEYSPWCTGAAPDDACVPGVEVRRAALLRRLDPDGERRWACLLTFSLTSAALVEYFPAAAKPGPVGIDPGLRHPLTWASADDAQSLPNALVDLDGFHQGDTPGRASRQACWARHDADYQQAWHDVLRHGLVRLEDTHWRTLVATAPEFVAHARSNYLWTWASHLAALAPLTGSQLELIPSRLTSRTCSACGYVLPHRLTGWFNCPECHYRARVDVNAARNIYRGGCPHPLPVPSQN